MAYGQAVTKDCCKNSNSIPSQDSQVHAGFDYCVDVPAWVPKYASRNRPGGSRYKDAVAVRLDFLSSCLEARSSQALRGVTMPFSEGPPLAALETIVLLI